MNDDEEAAMKKSKVLDIHLRECAICDGRDGPPIDIHVAAMKREGTYQWICGWIPPYREGGRSHAIAKLDRDPQQSYAHKRCVEEKHLKRARAAQQEEILWGDGEQEIE